MDQTNTVTAKLARKKIKYKVNRDFYPPEKPSFMFKATSYAIVIGMVAPAIHFFMRVLNSTQITGKENLEGLGHKWILASNHLSLWDDLFLGPVILHPQFFKGYGYFPYHAPEERNFYKIKLISWFLRQMKSIPLVRGNGIMQPGMDRLITAVKDDGILHIYPEGTRSRTGEIGHGRPGIGRIVCETNVPVVPVYHQGLEQVLPIGASIPRIRKNIKIAIGKPIIFDTIIEEGTEIKRWRAVAEEVIAGIKQQREVARKELGAKEINYKSNIKSQHGA